MRFFLLKTVLCFLLFSTAILQAEVIYSEQWDYFLDLPEGILFDDIENGGEKLNLSDQRNVYQLKIFPLTETFQTFVQNQGGEFGLTTAQIQFFPYNNRQAALANLQLSLDDGNFFGWVVWIERNNQLVRLVGLTQQVTKDQEAPRLLSFLDSFSPNHQERFAPGPISQAQFPLKTPTQALRWENATFGAVVGEDWSRAEQAVIERESQVLMRVQPQDDDQIARAWSRFYRMIYRETYFRVRPFAARLREHYEARGIRNVDLPKTLLSGLQNFMYHRRGDASDIDSSVSVLSTQQGDCDSLALLYLAILDNWGIKGLLMVSREYAHAMVALDLPGSGARFSFAGKQWLVAELTAKVPLGMIDSSMNDPRKWLGIDLKKEP